MFSELISSYFAGFKITVEAFEVLHGPKEACVNALKKGYLLGISPGGVREALFSDETYVIIWGSRKGFAQVAIDAKVVSMTYCRRKAKTKIKNAHLLVLSSRGSCFDYQVFGVPLLSVMNTVYLLFKLHFKTFVPFDRRFLESPGNSVVRKSRV